MARVLIAGCGYLGSALAARLARAGNEVVGIRRNPTSAGLFRSVAMDLAAAAELTTWLSGETGFDAVVCTVAAVARDEHSYRSAYVEALKSLQAGLRATHKIPPLFVFTSSTSVYHQDGGEWVDEETPTRPPAYRGRVQLEAEALVDAWPGARCSLRLGGIYGPGRTRLAAAVRDRVAAPRRVFSNRIHRDDAAGVLAHLIDRQAAGVAPAPLLLGVDDEPALGSEVVAWIAARLGIEPPERSADPPRGKCCRNGLLRRSDYAFRYPSYREGYAAILAADLTFPTFTPP